MVSLKSVAGLLFVSVWFYSGMVGPRYNLRGTERKLQEQYQELHQRQKEAGIEFKTGHVVGGSTITSGVGFFVHFGDGICGASLISGDRVLTAAHCVAQGAPATVRIGPVTQSDGTSIGVRCANTHPDYDGFVGNDLAVIKLVQSVADQTIALNTDANTPAVGDTVTVIGLGRTSTGGPVSGNLLSLDQTYVDPTSCDNSYGGNGVVPQNEVLCASATSAGACNGDSGGPLYINNGALQVGIVSFGSSAGCAAGIPDGYTRLSSYNGWITNQIFNNDCDCTFNPCALIFGGLFQVRDAIVQLSRWMLPGEGSI